jgi:hypothetical protein
MSKQLKIINNENTYNHGGVDHMSSMPQELLQAKNPKE